MPRSFTSGKRLAKLQDSRLEFQLLLFQLAYTTGNLVPVSLAQKLFRMLSGASVGADERLDLRQAKAQAFPFQDYFDPDCIAFAVQTNIACPNGMKQPTLLVKP